MCRITSIDIRIIFILRIYFLCYSKFWSFLTANNIIICHDAECKYFFFIIVFIIFYYFYYC